MDIVTFLNIYYVRTYYASKSFEAVETHFRWVGLPHSQFSHSLEGMEVHITPEQLSRIATNADRRDFIEEEMDARFEEILRS